MRLCVSTRTTNPLTEIEQEVLGVPLLRPNVVWPHEGVPDVSYVMPKDLPNEKDGPIEADEVVVAFLCDVSSIATSTDVHRCRT